VYSSDRSDFLRHELSAPDARTDRFFADIEQLGRRRNIDGCVM